MLTTIYTRFWSGRTLLALALFHLALVCTGEVGRATAAQSQEELTPRLSPPADCKDKLFATLRHAELLGFGQRTQTWDRIGPQLYEAVWLDPLLAALTSKQSVTIARAQTRNVSKQILLCIWLI